MSGNLKLRAGAGRAEIQYPAELFPFRDGPDVWTGIHDVPCARAVILEAGLKILLVSMEIVLMDRDLEAELRAMAVVVSGIPAEQIWLSATHTVTTPHFFVREHNSPEENAVASRMRKQIFQAAKAAIAQAVQTVQDASIGFGSGTCRANVNRVIETKDGWWLGSGEEFTADHAVPVVRIDGQDGQPLAILYNYNSELAVMDKSVMSDGGRHVTADLSGTASRFVEAEYNGKAVALYLPGVSTDQGPAYKAVRTVRGRDGSYRTVDIKEAGWTLLELQGERLGEQVLVAAERVQCAAPESPIRLENRTFWFQGQRFKGLKPKPDAGPVKQWTFERIEDKTRSVEVMALDSTALVVVDGIGVETAMKIKEQSPFENTVIVSSVSGGAKRQPTDGEKYMAEEAHYDRVTFQARNSEFAKGSAEKMRENVLTFLREIR